MNGLFGRGRLCPCEAAPNSSRTRLPALLSVDRFMAHSESNCWRSRRSMNRNVGRASRPAPKARKGSAAFAARRGRDARPSWSRLGSWIGCAIRKSWKVPMNLVAQVGKLRYRPFSFVDSPPRGRSLAGQTRLPKPGSLPWKVRDFVRHHQIRSRTEGLLL
jgi:hypothetical protein